MKYRTVRVLVLVLGSVCTVGAQAVGPQERPFDPLRQITTGFPKSIELKNKGKLLEFCPDNTCHGFVAKGGVAVTTLKDSAYLYVYFFSDYTYLEDWRATDGARSTAERVLSKPDYRSCKKDTSRESARCVLLDLAHSGRIKLIFVRYDEGQRNVVPEDLATEIADKASAPNQ